MAYPIYRYSDMILLQAEARARMGKWEEALDLVKQIRDRAGFDNCYVYGFCFGGRYYQLYFG